MTSKHGGVSVPHQSAVRKTSLFLYFFLNTSPLKRRRAEAEQEVKGCGARVLLTQDDMAAVKMMILWDGKQA